jgi:hypothetical protein
MHLLADFDNQTKLLHVGYSVLGVLVSMLVLVKLKPSIMPRMVTALILGFILVYCLSTPLTGDQERLKDIYSIGWFCLGLLFGIGRGEFVIEYLNRKFFGAPDQLADQFAKSEALRETGEGGKIDGRSTVDQGSTINEGNTVDQGGKVVDAGNAAESAQQEADAQAAIAPSSQPETQLSPNIPTEDKIEVRAKSGDAKSSQD